MPARGGMLGQEGEVDSRNGWQEWMNRSDSNKLAPYIEHVSESTVACLVTMVQGNLLALGLSHWLIASQTGIVAGVIASSALLLAKTDRRWLISLVLGIVTAVVDYLIHPGMFGPAAAEAIVTGVGAALLSYVVGSLLSRRRQARARSLSSPGI